MPFQSEWNGLQSKNILWLKGFVSVGLKKKRQMENNIFTQQWCIKLMKSVTL